MPQILPYPTFVSPKLKDYLGMISEQSGRYIVFCDADETPKPMALAWVDSDPEIGGAAIFISLSKINPEKYLSAEHDPIIAHEATHLQLWAEGWAKIECKNDPKFQESEKVSMIYNWLTDPIINKRIEKRGFSIRENRIQEVIESRNAISQGMWLHNLIKNPTEIFKFIRLFVSFSLEPNVPLKIKTDFQMAFKNTLPEAFAISDSIVALIKTNGFDTPDKFKKTAILCIVKLGIDIEKRGVYFKEPWQKFNSDERNKWALDNNVIS